MTDYQHDYIYCSALPDTRSLDQALADPASPAHRLKETADDPETALIRKRDLNRIAAWMASLPASLREVAEAALRDETQAAVAKRLGLTEAAISKRMKKLLKMGRHGLGDLRASPLLH